MNRNLDGIYFRINRDGRWQNICFTDLTKYEREEILVNKSWAYLKSIVEHLADRIRSIGEYFDIVGDKE